MTPAPESLSAARAELALGEIVELLDVLGDRANELLLGDAGDRDRVEAGYILRALAESAQARLRGAIAELRAASCSDA
jgi:hypothetical protein